MRDLVSQLDQWAERHSEQPLLSFLQLNGSITEEYTYGGFQQRSNAVAAQLTETGLFHYGEPVLLAYPPGLEMMVAFFACARLGALPVPVPLPEQTGSTLAGVDRFGHVRRDCGAQVALTSRATLERLQAARPLAAGSPDDDLFSSVHWMATDDLPTDRRQVQTRTHPILFLQYTSGSTQYPRGVMVSHANVLHNCQGTVNHRVTAVTWIPHYHDMGLIGGRLFPLITGGRALVFSPGDFLRRPLLWLEALTKYGGTMTAAPNFGYEYTLREDKVPEAALDRLALGTLQCLINGSEPVRAETFRSFLQRFRRCGLAPQALVVAYGLAENTLTVTLGGRIALHLQRRLLQRNQLRIGHAENPRQTLLSVMSAGTPLPGIDVRIVDPHDQRGLSENAIGEIWVRGASTAAGYWNQPALTQEVFGATMAGDDPICHYLRTGDLGFLHDGELFVCGRLKDMVKIRGMNFYPEDIETVVEQHVPGIRPASVAAFAIPGHLGTEAVAVLIEWKRRSEPVPLERIGLEIRRRCLLNPDVIALVAVGSLAKTSSGKIARKECQRRWLAGEIDALQTQRSNPEAAYGQVLGQLLKDIDLAASADLTLADLGIDSLTLVSLSLDLKKFLEERGHAGSVDLWDLKTLQTLRLGEIQRLVQDELLRGAQGPTDPSRIAAKVDALEQAERAQMRQDALLPADVAPQGIEGSGASDLVLLTGATGFFGAFLLEALLRLTTFRIVAPVRSQGPEHAHQRLRAALQRTGLFAEWHQEALAARVVALPGDLEQPRLGLDEPTWTRLATELAGIYHGGATVDYVKPYQSLRAANVQATHELLRLACWGRPKTFHLVSTTFVFGWSAPPCLRETDCNRAMEGLDFGYSQTKWVAEQLVLEAAQRGLPVRIYRPSLITASLGGRYAAGDINARALAYMMRHGIGIQCANQVSYLPADVAAHNLVALSLLPPEGSPAFHLTANRYYNMADVTAIISRDFGYRFRYVNLAEFVSHINAHCQEDEPLFPLVPFFNRNRARIEGMQEKRYHNDHYCRACRLSPVSLPEPDLQETVGAIVQFLEREVLVHSTSQLASTAPGTAP